MKKRICFVLLFFLVLSLCACGNDIADTMNTEEQQIETQQIVEEKVEFFAEEAFSLELVGYDATPSAHIVNIDFKFRNITDKNIERISFSAQGLDKNGDVIEDTIMGAENISAGQAAWYTYQTNSNRSCQTIEELSQKVYAINVYSVQIVYDIMDPYAYYDLNFKEPIVIIVADVEDKESVSNQAENGNIATVLLSAKWHRKDGSAVITFAQDNTGNMELSDGETYDFMWNVSDNNTVDVILNIDGREAPGSYILLRENGRYVLQMIDNEDFTYYAQ